MNLTPPRVNLKITDERNKQENFGKEIFRVNPEIYTERVVEIIKNHIAQKLPAAGEPEKSSVFYRSIYDYWVYGNTIMEEFHYNFSDKTHEEKSSYLTTMIRVLYCDHMNDKDEANRLLDDKFGAYKFLRQYYHRDVILIHGEGDYENFCEFVKKHPTFIIKPVNFGVGLYVAKDSVNNYKSMRELFDKLLSERVRIADDKERTYHLKVSGEIDLVLEEVIEQAPETAAFHPESVNCVRICTFRNGDEVKVFYPYFKTGVGKNVVDNAAAGSLFAVINISTGVIETDFFDENFHLNEPVEYHPDTGLKIRGFQMPRWDEAVDLVKECAGKFKNIRYIGWDLALTPRGWCIVEGNSKGGMIFQQVVGKKGIRREFEELCGLKPEKEFWWQYNYSSKVDSLRKNFSGKRLLLLGGNLHTKVIAEYAKENGITLIAAGNNPKAKFFEIAQETYDVSSADSESMKKLIRDKKNRRRISGRK